MLILPQYVQIIRKIKRLHNSDASEFKCATVSEFGL